MLHLRAAPAEPEALEDLILAALISVTSSETVSAIGSSEAGAEEGQIRAP